MLGVRTGACRPGRKRCSPTPPWSPAGARCSRRSTPPGARQRRPRQGPRRDAATQLAAAQRAASACSPAATPASSGSSGRSPRSPQQLDVHPAPSSVAVAFARLGLPWDDALVISAHARDPRPAINAALRHPKVAILTQPGGAEQIVAALAGRDADRRRGARHARRERLQPRAAVRRAQRRDRRSSPTNGRATIWPPRTPTRWALPESAFEHRAGMITKAEVRALALAALGPGTGDLVWDVGCGSGSVAIECARLGAAAIAIDHDPDAIALTLRNAAAHAVPVRAIAGAAPGRARRPPRPRRRLHRRRRQRTPLDPRSGHRPHPPRDRRHARAGRAHRPDDRAARRAST